MQITQPKPICEYCDEDAVALAPQSTDGGETHTWHLVCRFHSETWWDGSDWIAELYALERVEPTDEQSTCWDCNHCPEHHVLADHAPRWAENRPYCPVCPGENR